MKRLQDKTNVNAPDADFPYGDLRDDPGNQTGTPGDRDLFSDGMQTFEKIMDESGVAPNGLLDNSYTGFQLFEAHSKVFGRKFIKEFESEFDGEIVTISQAEIENAFGGFGFGAGSIVGSSESELCDLSIDVWYLSSGVWYAMPLASGAGGANIAINDSTGEISITLNVAPVSPAVRTRIIVQG